MPPRPPNNPRFHENEKGLVVWTSPNGGLVVISSPTALGGQRMKDALKTWSPLIIADAVASWLEECRRLSRKNEIAQMFDDRGMGITDAPERRAFWQALDYVDMWREWRPV